MDKYKVLKDVFGYDTFREGQEGLIDSTLAGRDVLGIMPTGAGKSICFQVPALLFQGITIVVSPLISLMKDQVAALNAAGVHAAFINSSLTEGQYRKAMEFAARGRYKDHLCSTGKTDEQIPFWRLSIRWKFLWWL